MQQAFEQVGLRIVAVRRAAGFSSVEPIRPVPGATTRSAGRPATRPAVHPHADARIAGRACEAAYSPAAALTNVLATVSATSSSCRTDRTGG